MDSFVYFDGLSSKAWICKIHIRENEILIQLDESLQIISWKIHSLISKELTDNTLTLKYGNFPHETLEIKGDNALDFYELISKNTLREKSKIIWFRKRTSLLIGFIFGFLLVCILSYLFLIPWLGEKATLLVPKSTEIQLGETIAENFKENETVNTEASFLINTLLDSLHVNESYQIKVTVIKSPIINAFALPGGQVFIYTGIIEKMNDYQELVALLGHEITHVTHQHSLKSLGRTAASSIFISALFGDISGISAGILDQANQLKQLRYSRELETEADQNGVDFMLKYKVSPEGMLDLMKILDTENKETNSIMKYLSTHPDTRERIATLKLNKTIHTKFADKNYLKNIFNNIKKTIK